MSLFELPATHEKMVVEIFKTDVTEAALAARLVSRLTAKFEGCKFNFDLQDCDNILRAEGPQNHFQVQQIIEILHRERQICERIAD